MEKEEGVTQISTCVCECLFFFGLVSVSVYDCGQFTIILKYFFPSGIVEFEILSTEFTWELLQV